MLYLHRVAHGVNIRVRGLHLLIDGNAVFGAKLKAGRLSQSGFRLHADG